MQVSALYLKPCVTYLSVFHSSVSLFLPAMCPYQKMWFCWFL